MKKIQVAVIVGSLRKDSLNRKLAHALETMAPPEFVFKELRIDDLPLYNQDNDGHHPSTVSRFKEDVQAADALLFVTPEYNRSIPGVLKNALDHGSRPYGQNSFAKKPAGVIGISVGQIGTALAQQHLRNVLAYLDVPTLNQPEAFIQDKPGFFAEQNQIGPDSQKFLQSWMDAFVKWVKTNSCNDQ